MQNTPRFTVSDLQRALTSESVRVVSSDGQSETVGATQLAGMFAPETPVTPNGHNGSYTIYSENGYTVITPVQKPELPWSSF